MTQEELLSQILDSLNATNERLDTMYQYAIERDQKIDAYIQQKDEESLSEKEEAKQAEQSQKDATAKALESTLDYTQVLNDLSTHTVAISKSMSDTNDNLKVSNTFLTCIVVILGLLCGFLFARCVWRKF